MRDQKRIEVITSLLKEAWERCPDMRLGQFLINYVFNVPPISDRMMWHQEDHTTEEILKGLVGKK